MLFPCSQLLGGPGLSSLLGCSLPAVLSDLLSLSCIFHTSSSHSSSNMINAGGAHQMNSETVIRRLSRGFPEFDRKLPGGGGRNELSKNTVLEDAFSGMTSSSLLPWCVLICRCLPIFHVQSQSRRRSTIAASTRTP